MAQWILRILGVLLAALVQGALLPALHLAYTPDVMLCLVIAVTLIGGGARGFWTALAGGLIVDLLSGPFLGYAMAGYLLSCAAAMGVARLMDRERVWLAIALALALAPMCELLQGVYAFLEGMRVSFGALARQDLLPAAGYNALWMAVSYPILRRIARTRWMQRERRMEFWG